MKISRRQLSFGPHRLLSRDADPGAAPYVIGGPHMYALGHGSAELGPIGAEHLVGEMGGIWAHPLKIADGVAVDLLGPDGVALAVDEATLCEELGAVVWSWRCGSLAVERRDAVPADAPAYTIRVTLANRSDLPASGALRVAARLKFLGTWFGGIASDGGAFRQDGNLIVGQDGLQLGWGLALGCVATPTVAEIIPQDRGALAVLLYPFQLAPGATSAWDFLLVAAHTGGGQAATDIWRRITYTPASAPHPAAGLPALTCATGDLALNTALAQANLCLLRSSSPHLGRYFLAGLPEYPQLFGCDTAYSVAGAAAGGLAADSRSALASLVAYAQHACGRAPHEITTNGRVFHPGNIQETPQLTIAVWDYLRWSGDLAFAREVFPVLREGMVELLPSSCGPSGSYPYGDGIVERLGMGSRKLDSACYTIAGLAALASIAAAIGAPDAPAYAARAESIRAEFERDWWIESEGLYGDSMHSDGALQLDGHWTAVLPVQLGLAAPARAARSLDRIMAEFTNEWGLVHTRAREELVWTLPTGLLALALFAHGRAEDGLRMTENIAATTRHGTLGTFKELIPQGLCFIQLWSAAIYLQAIFEGLLGLRPDAPAHRLEVAPCLPVGLAPVNVRGLRVGAHVLDIIVSAHGLQLHHTAGPQPLHLTYAGSAAMVAVGAIFQSEEPRAALIPEPSPSAG